jgi:hypothetical protein
MDHFADKFFVYEMQNNAHIYTLLKPIFTLISVGLMPHSILSKSKGATGKSSGSFLLYKKYNPALISQRVIWYRQ